MFMYLWSREHKPVFVNLLKHHIITFVLQYLVVFSEIDDQISYQFEPVIHPFSSTFLMRSTELLSISFSKTLLNSDILYQQTVKQS